MADSGWGDAGRDYSNYFINQGIAFVGGEPAIERMTKEVQVGDILVLKKGLSKIAAVGEVVERNGSPGGIASDKDKSWLLDFDGWILPAYRYVDWHVPSKESEESDIKGLRIGTLIRLPQIEHQEKANKVLSSSPAQKREAEPQPVKKIVDDEILEHLISEGMRVSSADDLTATLKRIRLLANYYYEKCNWGEVREHETRSFLVIPLLLALGWSEQQLKIELPCEGGKVDIACFPKSFTSGEAKKCILLVETKGFSQGLDYASEQAERYRRHFPQCQGVLVTNGYCYKAYKVPQGDDKPKVYAYLNLLQPKTNYPLDPRVEGALTVLSWLLPGYK